MSERPDSTASGSRAPSSIRLPSRTLFLHAAVFAALTIWSWRKWPDPLIDFGRELYTPWQLSTGKVLYLDVASLFGPFSQYLNALWFTLFGVSLTTLILCNLAILAGVAAGIHYLVRESTDSGTATAASLLTLILFGFSQYASVGNYNFVTPYSHEATHSIALSIAIMIALSRGVRTRRVVPFAFGGLLMGCLVLTKVETALAMAIAVPVFLSAATMLGPEDRRAVGSGALALAGCAVVVPAAFVGALARHMPLGLAARAVAGSWLALLNAGIASSPFYARGSGMDEPTANTVRMLTMFGGFVLFVLGGTAADRMWPQRLSFWPNLLWRASRLLLLGIAFLYVPWAKLPRALPLISAAALATLLVMVHRKRRERASAVRLLPLVMWAAFSLALLAKIILNARIHHYGFFLALPATVLVVIVLLWLVPGMLAGRGAHGEVFRLLAGLMLLAAAGGYLGISAGIYRIKQQPVGTAGDRFYAFAPPLQWQGSAADEAVKRIDRLVPPDATMAVLPEGAMINYLSRRRNPSPYIVVMPPELLAFGEGRVLQSLQATPPDYVVLVRKDESEYGVPPFGTDPVNGARLAQWVRTAYRRVDTIGTNIEILKHSN
jgi:hypothetical protein